MSRYTLRLDSQPVARWQAAGRAFEPDPPEFDQPDRCNLALVLGLVSFLIGPLGIVAWLLADACLRDIAHGRVDPTGEWKAKFARVLGIVATCMFLVKLATLVPLYAFVGLI